MIKKEGFGSAEVESNNRFRRFDSEKEAAAAVKGGTVDVAYSVRPYHDDPPGDWYIKVDIICKPELSEAIAKIGFNRGSDVDGLPSYGHAYFTEFMGGPVEPKPAGQVTSDESTLGPKVEKRAEIVKHSIEEILT